jgi:ABC-type bacteriocin/lantibiotic exporter with double-glycine peptidase domain
MIHRPMTEAQIGLHQFPEPPDGGAPRHSVPVPFLSRLAELSEVFEGSAAIASAEPLPEAATWQQALEQACAAHGMRARTAVWTTSETIGAAGTPGAFVSVRSKEGSAPEWFALADRTPTRVRLVEKDGESRWMRFDALREWLGDASLEDLRSWCLVESRFPSSIGVRSQPSHAGAPPHGSDGPAPFQRLVALLRPEHSDLWAILLFAALIGGLTLATPIAVQQLVNTIAFGGLVQPVVLLALLLLAVLTFSAVLSVVQAYVAELIQRRIFVRVVIDVAERLPRVVAQAFDQHHGPELVNRVFDVVTVQKVGSMLLLEGTAVLLQTIVGLIVLSFYHPLMLGFSGLLIVGIAVVVLVMGRGAVDTAIAESKAKYDVVGWLEELANHSSTFRDADQRAFTRRRADALASAYVGARSHHYRIVLRQLSGALGLQVLASSALLALGGMLVVQGQLTLGQLVASELIITVIVAAVAKFGKQLESYYDLLAAMDKLSVLTDLPLERENGSELERTQGPATIEMVGVQFGFGPVSVFRDFDLHWEAGERVAIEGAMGTGKSSLLDLLLALRTPSSGSITIDGCDYRDLRLDSLRKSVALVRDPEIFSGTIRENIRVGRKQYANDDVLRVLDSVGLLEEIRALEKGLDTRLSPDGRPLSQVQVTRLMLARALLAQPRLLLIDRALEDLDPPARQRICDMLFDPRAPWTLAVVSEREDVLERCTQRLTLGGPEVWKDADRPTPDPASPPPRSGGETEEELPRS